MAVAVDGEAEFSFESPVELFAGAYALYAAEDANSYDVARDGRFLMIEPRLGAGAEAARGFVVVQNWAEDLARRVPSRP